jgi:hypothetical protein
MSRTCGSPARHSWSVSRRYATPVSRGRRPLSDLWRRLERLENGNFGVRVSERAVAELAQINRHFDHMVGVLGTP